MAHAAVRSIGVEIPKTSSNGCDKHLAIDLGSHFNESYQKDSHKVRLTWELHGENQVGSGVGNMDDGKPFLVDAEYKERRLFQQQPKQSK